jgi:hypothetical protein
MTKKDSSSDLSQLPLDPIAISNQGILRCFEALQQRLRGGGAVAALLFQQLNDPPLSPKIVELSSGDMLLRLHQSLRQRRLVHWLILTQLASTRNLTASQGEE